MKMKLYFFFIANVWWKICYFQLTDWQNYWWVANHEPCVSDKVHLGFKKNVLKKKNQIKIHSSKRWVIKSLCTNHCNTKEICHRSQKTEKKNQRNTVDKWTKIYDEPAINSPRHMIWIQTRNGSYIWTIVGGFVVRLFNIINNYVNNIK